MRRKPFEAGDIVVIVASTVDALLNGDQRKPAAFRKKWTCEGSIDAPGHKKFVQEYVAAEETLRKHPVRDGGRPDRQGGEGARCWIEFGMLRVAGEVLLINSAGADRELPFRLCLSNSPRSTPGLSKYPAINSSARLNSAASHAPR